MKLLNRLGIAWRAERLKCRTDIELFLLPSLVEPHSLAIDIGANKGVYSYHLQKLARVAAFEPIPMLAEQIADAGFNRIEVHNCGLGREPGYFELRIPFSEKDKKELNTPSATFRTLAAIPGQKQLCFHVEVKRLDDFRFDNVSFMKVDVEGWEEQVLEGGEETIANNRPVILIELVERIAPGVFDFVKSFLSKHGYEMFFAEHGGRKLHSLATLNSDNPQAYNFLAFPTEKSAALVANCNTVLAGKA